MTHCRTIGSIEENTPSLFVWKIPKFRSLTANVGDFYWSPDIHIFDGNVYNLCIFPEGTASIPGFTTMQLLRMFTRDDEYVRFSLGTYGAEYSVQDDFIINETFATNTCVSSDLFLLMKRSILLKRLKIYNSSSEDVLRLYLSFWIDRKAVPTSSGKKRLILSRVILTEDVSSDTAVREELREQLDAKVSIETQTEDVSSDAAIREELREQLDVKVSRETQTEDESSDTADREKPREQLDVKSFVSLGQNLKDLYLSEKNYDVTITVRNRTFKVHRAVLQARAPLLADIHPHRMAENSDETICVMDCEPNAFAVFLLFVYSGTVENLSGENVADVFFVADKYALPELKEKCVRYMLDSLATGSICNIIALASRHGERELLERATEFFIENAQDILPTVQWRRFMLEHPDQANELYMKSLAFYTSEK